MFSKIAPISLLLSALYVNALSIPVAREPAPEPEYDEMSGDLFSRGNAGSKPGLPAPANRLLFDLPMAVAKAALGSNPPRLSNAEVAKILSEQAKTGTKRGILDDVLSREVQDWARWV